MNTSNVICLVLCTVKLIEIALCILRTCIQKTCTALH